jgi:hypothetical protein
VSTVTEIKQAVEKLSLSERAEFAKWFNGWEDDEWDRQMASDFAPGGKHADVLREVDGNIAGGRLDNMP